MNDDLIKLVDILKNLRIISTQPNKNTILDLIDKYCIFFFNDNFNSIYSNELFHYMKTNVTFNIDYDEFLKLIPQACNLLDIKCEPIFSIMDLGKLNSTAINYKVTLL